MAYDGMDPISTWADTLLGGGPEGGRIEVYAGEIRLPMAGFKVDVPVPPFAAPSGPRTGPRERLAGTAGAAAGWLTARLTASWRSRSTPPCHTERTLITFRPGEGKQRKPGRVMVLVLPLIRLSAWRAADANGAPPSWLRPHRSKPVRRGER